MTEIEQLREELRAEKLRVSALRTLVASLEKQRESLERDLGFFRIENDWRKDAATLIESEREANEILTNEIESLQQTILELRSELRSSVAGR